MMEWSNNRNGANQLNPKEILRDLKVTLSRLYYALDDEWSQDGTPFDYIGISSLAKKYGWSREEIVKEDRPL